MATEADGSDAEIDFLIYVTESANVLLGTDHSPDDVRELIHRGRFACELANVSLTLQGLEPVGVADGDGEEDIDYNARQFCMAMSDLSLTDDLTISGAQLAAGEADEVVLESLVLAINEIAAAQGEDTPLSQSRPSSVVDLLASHPNCTQIAADGADAAPARRSTLVLSESAGPNESSTDPDEADAALDSAPAARGPPPSAAAPTRPNKTEDLAEPASDASSSSSRPPPPSKAAPKRTSTAVETPAEPAADEPSSTSARKQPPAKAAPKLKPADERPVLAKPPVAASKPQLPAKPAPPAKSAAAKRLSASSSSASSSTSTTATKPKTIRANTTRSSASTQGGVSQSSVLRSASPRRSSLPRPKSGDLGKKPAFPAVKPLSGSSAKAAAARLAARAAASSSPTSTASSSSPPTRQRTQRASQPITAVEMRRTASAAAPRAAPRPASATTSTAAAAATGGVIVAKSSNLSPHLDEPPPPLPGNGVPSPSMPVSRAQGQPPSPSTLSPTSRIPRRTPEPAAKPRSISVSLTPADEQLLRDGSRPPVSPTAAVSSPPPSRPTRPQTFSEGAASSPPPSRPSRPPADASSTTATGKPALPSSKPSIAAKKPSIAAKKPSLPGTKPTVPAAVASTSVKPAIASKPSVKPRPSSTAEPVSPKRPSRPQRPTVIPPADDNDNDNDNDNEGQDEDAEEGDDGTATAAPLTPGRNSLLSPSASPGAGGVGPRQLRKSTHHKAAPPPPSASSKPSVRNSRTSAALSGMPPTPPAAASKPSVQLTSAEQKLAAAKQAVAKATAVLDKKQRTLAAKPAPPTVVAGEQHSVVVPNRRKSIDDITSAVSAKQLQRRNSASGVRTGSAASERPGAIQRSDSVDNVLSADSDTARKPKFSFLKRDKDKDKEREREKEDEDGGGGARSGDEMLESSQSSAGMGAAIGAMKKRFMDKVKRKGSEAEAEPSETLSPTAGMPVPKPRPRSPSPAPAPRPASIPTVPAAQNSPTASPRLPRTSGGASTPPASSPGGRSSQDLELKNKLARLISSNSTGSMDGSAPPPLAPTESFVQIKMVANRLVEQVPSKDRKFLMRKYRTCVASKEIVAWLLKENLVRDESEGVEFGQRMMDCGILEHVSDPERGFEKSSALATVPPFYTWLPPTDWHPPRKREPRKRDTDGDDDAAAPEVGSGSGSPPRSSLVSTVSSDSRTSDEAGTGPGAGMAPESVPVLSQPKNPASTVGLSAAPKTTSKGGSSDNMASLTHEFAEAQLPDATLCEQCRNFISALKKEGMQCTSCQMAVHRKCVDSVPASCGQDSSSSTIDKDRRKKAKKSRRAVKDDSGGGEKKKDLRSRGKSTKKRAMELLGALKSSRSSSDMSGAQKEIRRKVAKGQGFGSKRRSSSGALAVEAEAEVGEEEEEGDEEEEEEDEFDEEYGEEDDFSEGWSEDEEGEGGGNNNDDDDFGGSGDEADVYEDSVVGVGAVPVGDNGEAIYEDVDDIRPPTSPLPAAQRPPPGAVDKLMAAVGAPPSAVSAASKLAQPSTSNSSNSNNNSNNKSSGSAPAPAADALYAKANPQRAGKPGKPPIAPKPGRAWVSKTKEGYDDEDIYESLDASKLKQRGSTTGSVEEVEELEEPSPELANVVMRPNAPRAALAPGAGSRHSILEVRMLLNSRPMSVVDRLPALPGDGEDGAGSPEGEGLAEDAGAPPPPPAAAALPDSVVPLAFRQKNQLWREQEHVVAAGVVEGMDKTALRRQESIFEFAYSEESFLNDVRVLINSFLLHLDAHSRSVQFKGGEAMFDPALLSQLMVAAKQVQAASSAFLGTLRERQAAEVVVGSVSDIVLLHAAALREAFFAFSEMSVLVRPALDHKSAAFVQFLKDRSADPELRGLPLDAFLLAPIQRVARYPLLIEAIVKTTEEGHGDREGIVVAHETMQSIVKACNDRMREIEDQLMLEEIEGSLDFSRLDEHVKIVDEEEPRTLVKRGPVELLTVVNRKVTKSKVVEFMLFSDLFVYAKPVKVKKTGKTKYIVYKQVFRSLLDVAELPPDYAGAGAASQNLLGITIYEVDKVVELVVRTSSMTDKTRWMDAFSPPKGEDDEDIYQSWDCPRARALYDYSAGQADELPLREGDLVNITIRGKDGWCKGYLVNPPRDFVDNNIPTSGWFPTSYVKEIHSQHQEARMIKATHQLKGSLGRSMSQDVTSHSEA